MNIANQEFELSPLQKIECETCGVEAPAAACEEEREQPMYAKIESSVIKFYCESHFEPVQQLAEEAEKQQRQKRIARSELNRVVDEKRPVESRGKLYRGPWRRNRRKALERDGYTCQDCGMSEYDHEDIYNCGLHVHHIRPVVEFDNYYGAHDLSNLVTLCMGCHIKWEELDEDVQRDRIE